MEAAVPTAPVLEQRVLRGARIELAPGAFGEVVFVAAGEGTLSVGGESHALETESGAFVGPGEVAAVEAAAGELELVVVRTPPADLTSGRVVRYGERDAQVASSDRWFHLLVETTETTQFVGLIAPGRAKMHNHPYEESAWLIEGDGVVHWHEGESAPVSRGSRIEFPRLAFHSLENTLDTTMRIMGVFHPAGSPADRVEVLDY